MRSRSRPTRSDGLQRPASLEARSKLMRPLGHPPSLSPRVRGLRARRREFEAPWADGGVVGSLAETLVDRVHDGALRRGHGAIEQWVLGPHHPLVQSSPQILCDLGESEGRRCGSLLRRGRASKSKSASRGGSTSPHPSLQKDVLGQAVVQVGQHPPWVLVVVAAHVLVPGGANGTLRFVGSVIGHLREDLVVDLGRRHRGRAGAATCPPARTDAQAHTSQIVGYRSR